jgi:predicted nuclease of predicted toxin-antitoxin system
MNALIDAQLPELLVEILAGLNIHAIHVNGLPKGDESSDIEITEYADKENLIVFTKDQDFFHSHLLMGKPKKLLLITSGNIKNRQLFDLFRANSVKLMAMFEKSNFVEMSNDGLILAV